MLVVRIFGCPIWGVVPFGGEGCYLEMLKKFPSNVRGGPAGMATFLALSLLIENPRWRLGITALLRCLRTLGGRPWQMRNRENHDLVFCHNDPLANNVIVDPHCLESRAIVDWEYAGFYPPEFEAPFYRRLGPSSALEGDVDDVDALLQVILRERM